LSDDPTGRPWRFVSLRWRAIGPLALVVTALAMAGAYVISGAAAQGVRSREVDHLLVTSRAVADRMGDIGTAQRREVTRIAYTQGVAQAIHAGDGIALQTLLEPLALAADLDYVLVADANDQEVLGLQRVDNGGGAADYAVASGTDLETLIAKQPALFAPGTDLRAAITRTGQGHALMTAGPVMLDDKRVGTILAGVRIERLLDALRGGDTAELALFGPDGVFVRTTLPFDDTTRAVLALDGDAFQQALTTPGQVPVENLEIEGKPYNAAYLPLVINGTPLGVLGVYRVDDTLYATWLSREWISTLAAVLVGMVVLVTFVVVGRFANRLERVTRAAGALAAGDARARTRMKAHDEIGELGVTLDRLADRQQHRTDALQKALRRQRAETARLSAILESIPDGLVVQDLDGRVLLINDAARHLLGGQRVFRSARLHDLTAVVTERLGPALAPGIYALGDPTRIALDGKMLQAQAAAITIRPDQQRIGTVIVLRDITPDVQREQKREELLGKLTEQALAPRAPQAYESLSTLAREVVHNTRAIQQVIAELRDLSTFEPRDLETGQRPHAVNDLVWHVAAEWEPLARAARIRLRVKFGPRGYYVLGDERRLRWAIGNLVDNALKYSPPHTTVTLNARLHEGETGDNVDSNGVAEIVVEDQGYGLAPQDLEHAFARFYRGTPRDGAGKLVRKPGTGQGLFIARRVIEAHGGQISLASRVGRGTTAVISLPLTAPVTLDVSEPHALEDIELSQGEYETRRLEPRRFPWERREKPKH
jgi:two-component system sensor histidine kinase ResE